MNRIVKLNQIKSAVDELLSEEWEADIDVSDLHFIEKMAAMLVNLKETRNQAGLKLREVESKTGLSNAYISQLENGKIENPSFNVVVKLYCLYNEIQIPKYYLV